jgi:hypothetical protein
MDRKPGLSSPIGGVVVDYAGEAGVAGHSISTEDAWMGLWLGLA